MAENDSFRALLAGLHEGEEDAARAVFERYGRGLIAMPRQRLGAVLATKVEPEDVVQSVYKSFFWRFGEAQFDLAGWASLWNLLVVITVRKCANQAQHFQRECRATGREVRPEVGDSGTAWEAVSREPTPVAAAVLTETLEGVLREFEPAEREIIALSLQGHSVQEIKQQLGRPERTVRRVRERVRHQLEKLHEGSE